MMLIQVSLLCYSCKLQVECIYETDTWLAEGEVELVTNKLPFDNLKKMLKIVIIYQIILLKPIFFSICF
jgi:hypothetical protein